MTRRLRTPDSKEPLPMGSRSRPRFAARAAALCSAVCLAAAVSATTGLAPAYAQTDPEPQQDELASQEEQVVPGTDGAPPPADSDVESITVTGKAATGSTQALPEAITSFDQTQLDTLGIANVDTLALNTPSMHIGQFGAQPVITLRGVGVENLTAIGEPGIGFEVDGIHQGRPAAANATFYDLEGVFVERGPQGNQGGRQTSGGRITLRSKKPDEVLDAAGDIQYGSYDQLLFRGVANIPVWDEKLMTRSTVVYEKRDGYQENLRTDVRSTDADDADNLATRFQTRSLLADDRLELRAIGAYSFLKGNGPARHRLNTMPTNTQRLNNAFNKAVSRNLPEVLALGVPGCPVDDPQEPPLPGAPLACHSNDPRETYQDDVGLIDNDQGAVTGIINWDLPWGRENGWLSDVRLGAVGGWTRTGENSLVDLDTSNAPFAYFEQHRKAEQGSIEAFLERADIDRFDFKVGIFYFRERVETDFCIDANNEAVQPVDLHGEQDLLNQSVAGYGAAGYRLFDAFRFHGGLRYSNESKDASQQNTRYRGPAYAGEPIYNPFDCSKRYKKLLNGFIVATKDDGASTEQSESETWSKVTPDFGFDWELTDTNTFAFTYSTGLKAGGFALGVDASARPFVRSPYAAEEVTEYEVSLKNDFFERRLNLNLALFWTDYDPYQVCQIIGALYKCDAQGRATSRGIELEFTVKPIVGLAFNGHFNWLDTRVDRFWLEDPAARDAAGGTSGFVTIPQNQAGNSLPKAPEFAGSLGVQYAWDVGRWGIITPRAQVQAQTRTYFRIFNRPEFSQEPFGKFDVSLEWTDEERRFNVRGFVNNVNDVDVINFIFIGPQSIGGPALAAYLPPRTFGLRVGVNFTSDLF